MPVGLGALDGDERGERGVAVVGAAAAVEPVALDDRRPRPEARRASRPSPAACRGGRRAARCGRRAPGRVAGTSQTISGVRPGRRWTSTVSPAIGRAAHQSRISVDGLLHVAVRLPRRVERLGHVGDADVLGERRQDVVVPAFVDACRRGRWPRVVIAVSVADARARARSASATICTTSSPAGTSASMAPTPWPHGMNSRCRSTGVPPWSPRWLTPAARRGDDLGRERLQLLGVLLEVLRPVVAHDAARLAGEARETTVPSSGSADQRLLVAVDRAGLGRGDEAGADPHAVGAERQGGGEAAPVEEPAGGDDRDPLADGVDDLRARAPSSPRCRCGRRPRCPGRRRSRTRWRRR